MARKKVTLAYISNDATRRATLKKRRRGLMKKVNELSILCGVPACAIVYSPHEDKPEVFPSPEEATKIFKEMGSMPEIDKNKKMVNQQTFLEQRLLKLSQQVRRLEHENKELASAIRLRQCLDGLPVELLTKEDADALLECIDRRSKAVQTRMHQLGAAPPMALGLPVPPLAISPVVEKFRFDNAAVEAMRQCNWIGCGSGGGVMPETNMVDYDNGQMVGGNVYGGNGYGGDSYGGNGYGGVVSDDLLALLMEQEYGL